MAASRLRVVFHFGPFALYVATRRLLRNRSVVSLPPKAFDTLLTLVRNAGQVIGKEELLRAVWASDIVEESNLTQTVFLLRQALHDIEEPRRFIATVPKRGYCFVADVREGAESGSAADGSAPRDLIGRRFADHSDAHQLYLKGRHFWEKRTAPAVEKAIRCFQQAIDKQPDHAQAYAGLADCYTILSHYSRLSPAQTLPKAKASALRALEIDPAIVEAHTSLALVKMLYDWDWLGAGDEFHHALRINDNYATAHHWHGLYLAAGARFDEAVAELEYALQLEPFSLAINTDLGLVLYLARRYDEAIAQYRSAIDLDPAFSDAQEGMLMASNEMGMYYQPISELVRSPGGFSREVAATLDAAYLRAGVKGYWRAYLELAEDPSSDVQSSPYVRARIYAKVGEKKRALSWLHLACEERDGGLSLLKVDPALDSLRSDRRFIAILERVGLADAQLSTDQKPR